MYHYANKKGNPTTVSKLLNNKFNVLPKKSAVVEHYILSKLMNEQYISE